MAVTSSRLSGSFCLPQMLSWCHKGQERRTYILNGCKCVVVEDLSNFSPIQVSVCVSTASSADQQTCSAICHSAGLDVGRPNESVWQPEAFAFLHMLCSVLLHQCLARVWWPSKPGLYEQHELCDVRSEIQL